MNILSLSNPYINSVQILTKWISKINAKFIRNKSGLRLVIVLQFI